MGRQDADAELRHSAMYPDTFAVIVEHAGQQGGHEFAGIVAFHPCRLIGDKGVGGGVGFVEGVGGEALHLSEDGGGRALVHAAADTCLPRPTVLPHQAVDEDIPLPFP